MTISSEVRKAGPYTGNGVTVDFPFIFKVFASTDISVTLATLSTGAEVLLTSGYTVTLNADQNANPGGSVHYNPSSVPLPATQTLTIGSVVTNTQGTHIVNGGAFLPSNLEDMSDRGVILIQQLLEKVGRAIKFAFSDAAAPVDLPPASQRASKVLGFDAIGNVALMVLQAGTSLVNLAASSGAALIGYIDSGLNAVIRTLQDKSRERPSVFDFMTGAQIANIQAQTYDAAAQAGVTDAINAALAAHDYVEFPEGGYLVTKSIRFARPGQQVFFKRANIKASGTVTDYDQILTGGTDAPLATPLYTILNTHGSLASQWDGDVYVDGANIAYLVGLASGTITASTSCWASNFNARMQFYRCAWSIYGQATTSGNGAFVGCRFAYVYQDPGSNTIGSIYMDNVNDDIEMGTVRVSSGIVANNRGWVINNLFLNGGAYTGALYPAAAGAITGLQLGSACRMVVHYCLIEGNFVNPFFINASTSLQINSLRISAACDAQYSAAVYASGANCSAQVSVLDYQGILDYVIARAPGATDYGNFLVTCPYKLDLTVTVKPQPFKLDVNGANSVDTLRAEMTDGSWIGKYSFAGGLVYNKVMQQKGYLEFYDQAGTFLGYSFSQNGATVAVTNGGTFVIDGSFASYIALNSADAAATINIFAGTHQGHRIKLVSNNAANNITVTAGTTIKLAAAAANYALLPAQANSITLVWDGAHWAEESRIAY